MPKLAFSTLACPEWNWHDVVAQAAKYRYDGVEVRQIAGETDLLHVPAFYAAQRAQRRAELRDAGVAVCGLASSVRFDYPRQEQRDEQMRIARAYVELAAELESGFIRVFGDVLPSHSTPGERSAVLAQIAEGLNRLGEFALPWNVDVLLETHGDFAQSSLVAELFRRIESPRVGVLWDTHHPWRFFRETPESTMLQLAPWLRHTHWKDSVTARRTTSDGGSAQAESAAAAAHALMSGHRHADYVLFGAGEFPAEECARLLAQSGYSGWLCLEWEKMWHPQIEEPQVALPLFPPKMRAIWQRASA